MIVASLVYPTEPILYRFASGAALRTSWRRPAASAARRAKHAGAPGKNPVKKPGGSTGCGRARFLCCNRSVLG
jgi:hypothetical protein